MALICRQQILQLSYFLFYPWSQQYFIPGPNSILSLTPTDETFPSFLEFWPYRQVQTWGEEVISMVMQPGEDDLPELLATDLDNSFQYFIEVYQHRLYSFILRQTGNAQDTEDILQETFLRAYFALRTYLPPRVRVLALRPWLYRIALNVFYSSIRKTAVTQVPLDFAEDGPHVTIEEENALQPETLLQTQESLCELEMLVSRLPAAYRDAVNCYYFEQLTYQEIADVLNIPLGTVKTHLHRGTRLLRQSLAIYRKR